MVVTVAGLHVGYRAGHDVLSGLDLDIPAGLTQLRGANGAGKSTLVEVVAGDLRPRAGRVELYGVDVYGGDGAPTRSRRRICRSRPAFYPTLTLREHLDLLVDAGVVDAASVLERCRAYGVADWLDVSTEQLSTGNLRKAWIVLSTAPEVELWVMDEPFNGLDTQGIEVLCAEIERRVGDGRDVTLIAHQLPAGLRPDSIVDLPLPLRDEAAA